MTPAPLAELIAQNCVRQSDILSAFPNAPVLDDSKWTSRVVRTTRHRLAASIRTVAAGIEPNGVTNSQPTVAATSQPTAQKRCGA